jgi:hypothetical protein
MHRSVGSELAKGLSGWAGRWVLIGLVGAMAMPAQAQTQSLMCPMRVASKAAAVAEQPGTGFTVAFLPTSLSYLTGVAVMDGQSATSADLPPTVQGGELQWRFESGARGAVLVCRYEGGIQLTRALGNGVRQCVASVQRSAARGSEGYGLDRASVVCQ